LVSWWGAENDANDRVGTNDAILEGGAGYAAGEVGRAFSLDGINAAINFGNQIGNFGTNDFAIDFWLKTRSTRQEVILSMRIGCYCTSFWNIFATDGYIQFEMCNDASCSIYQNLLESVKRVNDGLFHHIAVTRNNLLATIYVDGSVVASNFAAGVVMLSNNVPCFAAISPCSGENPFTGVLDEIQVYNRAITANEVQAIYAAGTNGMCPPAPLMFTGTPNYSRSNGVILDASLRSGQSYHIQGNTNLSSTNWTTLTNFVAGPAPVFDFTNKGATNVPQQFFRIISP
jgi:hypothetical protein